MKGAISLKPLSASIRENLRPNAWHPLNPALIYCMIQTIVYYNKGIEGKIVWKQQRYHPDTKW